MLRGNILRFRSFSGFRRFVRWFGGLELASLVSLIVLVMSLWGFLELADNVLEGDTQSLDELVVLSLRQSSDLAVPIGPEWIQEMGRDATALGGIGWIVFAIFCTAGFLLLDRKPHMALFLIASTLSGVFLSFVLKNLFSRPRPDIVPHLSHVYTSSFPSGHSMLAAVTYLTLGALVSTVVKRPRLKIYVMLIAVLLTIIVGVSRVYLGVHYPTDVLAGWLAGLFWALACDLIARRLQYLGKVEHT